MTATACLAGVLLPTLLAGRSTPAPTAVGPAGTTTAPTSAPTTAPPADPRIDPMVLTATFGWLPAELNEVTYAVNSAEQAEVNPSSHAPGVGSVTLSTGGWVKAPASTSGLSPTGPINGHPAYTRSWAPGANGPGTVGGNEIDFQSASGQWVQLTTYVLPPSDTLRIAEHLEFGAARSLPLPFQWSGQRSNPAVAGASYTTVDGKFTSTAVSTEINGETVSVSAARAGTERTAVVQDSAGVKSATRTVNGLRITVVVSSDSNATSVTGNPASYLAAITSLGPDPADWTRDVFTATAG